MPMCRPDIPPTTRVREVRQTRMPPPPRDDMPGRVDGSAHLPCPQRSRSPSGASTAACLGMSIRVRPASSSHSRVARACQRARGMLSSCASSAGRSGAAGRSAGEAAPAHLRCCLRRLRRQQPPPCASTRSYQRPARPPVHQARPARARRGLHGIARTVREERLHPPKAQATPVKR